MLALQIYSAPNGILWLDATGKAFNAKFTTNEHGFCSLTAEVELPLVDAFTLYDRTGLGHVVITDQSSAVVWEGRLEDVVITDGGVSITALGYWRALSDVPYTALWSDTSVAGWRPVLTAEDAYASCERWEMDTNNRLYMAPRKGETIGAPAFNYASYTYETPVGGDRVITRVSFTYSLLSPVGIDANLISATRGFTGGVQEWWLAGTGALQTGNVTVVLTSPNDRLSFNFYQGAAAGVFAGDTGTAYLEITNLRVITEGVYGSVGADLIAAALVTYVNGINSTQLSASSVLISAPVVELYDELYQDELPADILTKLAAYGDNSTPPNQWETGVWENRTLYFRKRGSQGRAWYVDVGSLQVGRSIATLANSVYGIYKNVQGRALRTPIATSASSITRYGLTKRQALPTRTTSLTQANVQRDARLNDCGQAPVRSKINVSELYDSGGSQWPLWMARSGDSVTIRNIPPTLSIDVDRIRTFRILSTSYDCMSNRLTIEPETPLPSLEQMVARREAGIT